MKACAESSVHKGKSGRTRIKFERGR
uniref:Uncharacterized protein n=1 Tax=Rhizophora mucronata TaxID=61149 RepID=A0A2P2IYK2_RHIMU